MLTKNSHPEELYSELARLGGALCTFGLESHPAQLPLYDHGHPTECFATLDHHVRTHLELVVPSNCVRIPLEAGARHFWSGAVADQRTLVHSQWILGVRCGIGESEIISGVPRLVKVCSQEFVPKLVARALPGMALRHLSVPPPAVNARVDWTSLAGRPIPYHKVPGQDSGDMLQGDNANAVATLLSIRLQHARRA